MVISAILACEIQRGRDTCRHHRGASSCASVLIRRTNNDPSSRARKRERLAGASPPTGLRRAEREPMIGSRFAILALGGAARGDCQYR
jgi:hypothetical protein